LLIFREHRESLFELFKFTSLLSHASHFCRHRAKKSARSNQPVSARRDRPKHES
jgi:hypothetical protein